MDLPTYTNIWRIEKRLYKLYDFRLPMPLPINWIAVFAGITIPYVVLLVAIGLPFNHSLVALYVLPPGLLTWLTTRPVIESKRLPELIESQLRYLTEPRTWVRLAPLSEKNQMTVTAWVWHSRPPAPRRVPAGKAAPAARPAVAASAAGAVAAGTRVRGRAGAQDPAGLEVSHDVPCRSAVPARWVPLAPASPVVVPEDLIVDETATAANSAIKTEPVANSATGSAARRPEAGQPQARQSGVRQPEPAPEPAPAVAAVIQTQRRPTVSVERALSGPARYRNLSWHGKVKIVTGAGAAAGPAARDQEALDRNRARLPIAEPKRILVLGCTSGAGQTVTALMTAAMLASLREHPVAAVDLHDGTLARYREPAAALADLLAGKPPLPVTPTRPDGLHPTPKPNPARLDVIASAGSLADGDEIRLAVQLNRHYPLTVLDPGAAGLTKLLKITDQLILVAPASADATSALATTREWLDNNGHADLAMQSVTVINGASRRSLPDVEQAESVAHGRSRAIVRIPWDDLLPVAAAAPSALRPQTRVAYTALAGVLVAGMATAGVRRKS